MEDVKVIIREYDEKGNEIHKKYSDGFEIWKEYNEKGNVTHIKDSDGYEIWKEYDEKGNVTHIKDSDGYEIWYDYDEKGNVAHCKNSDGDDESFFKTKAEEYYELIFNHYDSVDDLANLLNEMYNLGKEEYLYERTDDNY